MSRSPRIINFISDAPNIGNFTAFWGIDELIGDEFWPSLRIDCRRYASVDIDRYDVALVGGAGLLAAGFTPFWEWLARQRIPVIMFGLGVCLPDEDSEVPRNSLGGVPVETVRALGDRLLYANMRDRLTKDLYGLDRAEVTYCPTLAFVRARYGQPARGRNVLYAHHQRLVSSGEGAELRRHADDDTDNLMHDTSPSAILAKYLEADVVLTTRLHGAIIGVALGRPYVAVAHDEKLRAFHAEHGGGLLIDDPADAPDALARVRATTPEAHLEPLRHSAETVRSLLRSLPA